MKNKLINKFLNLSKNIKKILDENDYVCGKRIRKTKIVDGFVFNLLHGQKNISQQLATSKLNKMKGNVNINRSSYNDRYKQIPASLYERIYIMINDFYNNNFADKYTRTVFAVDCTQTLLNKHFSEEGFKLNKNKDSVNAFVLGVYNITNNIPVSLLLTQQKSERTAFIEYLDTGVNAKNNIYTFDRGYLGHKFFNQLTQKEIFFVCRLRENMKIIPKNSNDTVVDFNGTQIRVIKYIIDKVTYYLGTNLMDKNEYSIDILKQIYANRWSIEEYFKYIKTNTNFANIKANKKEDLIKSISGHLIVSRIINLLVQIMGPNKNNKELIINKKLLTEGFYEDFIYRFFYSHKLSSRTFREFIKNYGKYITTNKGEHVVRKSSIPYSKWYIKTHYNKFIKRKNEEKNKKKLEKLNLKDNE